MPSFWDQISAQLPDFEKPAAQGVQVEPGNLKDAIAHYDPSQPNKMFVDRPDLMTAGVAEHELMHRIQDQAGDRRTVQDLPSDYDYGGTAGLARLFRGGKSIAALGPEAQAEIPKNYTEGLATLRAKGKLSPADLAGADALNSAYAGPIRQEAAMARTAPGIDVTPAAPGPPPAALTGMIKPLPEVGGQTIYATHQDTGHRIMSADGGQSWAPAQ